MVEHGGKYAIAKRFSKAVMDLPPARQRLAVDTYYRGDGSECQDGPITRVRAATISRELAFQLQELWSRQGIFAYINVREAFDETMKDGKIIRHKKKYILFNAKNTPGPRLEDLVDAGRDRLGDHVEVPELHPPGRRLDRRVLLGGRGQQPAAGGHRHQDDPHRQEHAVHHHLQGHLGGPRAEHVSGPGA